MHMHVLMLHRKFELIPIKMGIFMNFKAAPNFDKIPCTIVEGHWPNFLKNDKERIFHFYYIF